MRCKKYTKEEKLAHLEKGIDIFNSYAIDGDHSKPNDTMLRFSNMLKNIKMTHTETLARCLGAYANLLGLLFAD